MAKYDKNNCEIPDKTPVELPIGYGHPEPLEQMIARLVNNQVAQAQLQNVGAETFEDSEDFDVPGSEPEMVSPYEITAMQDETPSTLFAAQPESTVAPAQATPCAPLPTTPTKEGIPPA